ncbi:MAG: hypothetical protein HRT35_14470 [Algicola sp.]|nr:hypothetical protein [Algicola sp.]
MILGVLSQISRFDSYIIVDEVMLDSPKWQKLLGIVDYSVWCFLVVIAIAMIWEIYTCGKRLVER